MTKAELLAAVSEQTGASKHQVENFFTIAFNAVIPNALKEGGEVTIPGFGKFALKHREQREGRNPATGETVTVPASNTVSFKIAKALKDYVNR